MATLMLIHLERLAEELRQRGHRLVESLAEGRPDLVLLDGRQDVMPGLMGALRGAGCPVVCVADATLPEQARDLVAQGASRLLYHAPAAGEVERLLGGGPTEETRDTMLRRIFERHRGTMEASVATIERVVFGWEEADGEDRGLAVLHAHRLAGTLGSFGLARGTELARGIERDLRAGSAEAVGPRVAELRREIGGSSPDRTAAPALNDPPAPGRTVLLVDDDVALTEALRAEGEALDLRVLTASDLTRARQLLGEAPQVVVLDLMLPDGEEGLAFLRELSETHPELPVIVLTSRGALLDRVEVARLGGRGFLVKPLAPSEVLDEVTRQLELGEAQRFKILAVDDDPVALDCLLDALTGPDLALSTLQDPLDFWGVLEEISPDLLLLDLEMPHVHGLDLLKALRNDQRYATMPVLVLTAQTGPNLVTEVYEAGADDFVRKPFLVPELRARVHSRLERFHLLRSLGETDALTRLANRRKASQAIEQFLLLATRQRQPFSLALLDVDHFKRVNDTRGHAVGDQVLRRLADHLRASFRGEDVVGRWGGEEFVVGMYGMTCQDGVARLERVLQTVMRAPFLDDPPEKISFSAGVAQFGLHGGNLLELYRHADGALYQAKIQGRARVLPAT